MAEAPKNVIEFYPDDAGVLHACALTPEEVAARSGLRELGKINTDENGKRRFVPNLNTYRTLKE
jgi:hypothetical protein